MAASSEEEFNGEDERFSSVQEEESSREHVTGLRKFELAQTHEFRMKQLRNKAEAREREIRGKERVEIRQAETDARIKEMTMRVKEMELKHQIKMAQLELRFLNHNNNNLSALHPLPHGHFFPQLCFPHSQ